MLSVSTSSICILQSNVTMTLFIMYIHFCFVTLILCDFKKLEIGVFNVPLTLNIDNNHCLVSDTGRFSVHDFCNVFYLSCLMVEMILQDLLILGKVKEGVFISCFKKW